MRFNSKQLNRKSHWMDLFTSNLSRRKLREEEKSISQLISKHKIQVYIRLYWLDSRDLKVMLSWERFLYSWALRQWGLLFIWTKYRGKKMVTSLNFKNGPAVSTSDRKKGYPWSTNKRVVLFVLWSCKDHSYSKQPLVAHLKNMSYRMLKYWRKDHKKHSI